MINNIYHARALRENGFDAVTFVTHLYYITEEFDVDFSCRVIPFRGVGRIISSLIAQCWVLFSARAIYIYFNGGPFGGIPFLQEIEPFLYSVSGIKVVVMPYGGDVQEMTRSPNLLFKHAVAQDYPAFRHERGAVAARIERWTRRADVLVSGVEWVDYMYHWDFVQVGHFSIDLDYIDDVCERVAMASQGERGEGVGVADGDRQIFRVLHAPNHRAIKGTQYLVDAIEELRTEGANIELVLIERMPNEQLLHLVADCDLVVDQLVIGWYAMFAIEGMAMGKPVVCRLRPDLIEFFEDVGALQSGDIPLVDARPSTIRDVLWKVYGMSPDERRQIGEAGRRYVEKYHSLKVIGEFFEKANRRMGIEPLRERGCDSPIEEVDEEI